MTAERKKFNKEIGEFVTTSGILLFINLMTSPGYLWCMWAIGFWGISLAGKYVRLRLDDEDANETNDYLHLGPLHYEEEIPSQKTWSDKDLV